MRKTLIGAAALTLIALGAAWLRVSHDTATRSDHDVPVASKDAVLGDTREVWFIRNGYLYEVTTLKPLEGWLQDIVQTWKFI